MWWTSWCTACAAKWTRTGRCCTRFGELVMSSGLLDPLRRNIGLRLSLLYALIFTLSSVALLAIAYYTLKTAVEAKDREVAEARLKDAAVVYQAGGEGALKAWVNSEPEQVRNTMFVRLVNPAYHRSEERRVGKE